MLGLRQKLLIAFSGLFLLLILMAGLEMAVIGRVSLSFEKIFHENLETINACEKMHAAMENLNEEILVSLWEENRVDSLSVQRSVKEFETALLFQHGNVTVRGEQALTDRLAESWKIYRSRFPSTLDTRVALGRRREVYQKQLLGTFREIGDLTQKISDLNAQNILSTDGQVKHQARAARVILYGLLFAGIGLILIILLVTARLVLKPIQTLTRSAKEIEKGNLELVLEVRSRDEMGQLAEAFNAMASRLREFRRTDQARLMRSQQATQAAINSLPDAVAVLNASGEIEIANQAAVEIFGIKMGTRADTLGLPWLRDMFNKVSREWKPVQPKGYESAVQMFRAGRESFFLPQAIPILDENKGLEGVTVVLADVTELRRLDETKSDLLATVSHELKTSLTSVRMAIHLLLDDKVGELNRQQSELVLAAREDADRLHHIIEGLLDMGRIQAGRMEMEIKPMATQEIVEHALDEFRAPFKEKGVSLSAGIPADIPVVLADPTRVHHILRNLLDNAIRFTSPGGEVHVTAEPRERYVLFKVRDTGAGIPRDYVPRVFERFFRVPGKSGSNGAGLGLAIVREIVMAHGGEVNVQSKEGEGSVFSFTLPAGENGELTK